MLHGIAPHTTFLLRPALYLWSQYSQSRPFSKCFRCSMGVVCENSADASRGLAIDHERVFHQKVRAMRPYNVRPFMPNGEWLGNVWMPLNELTVVLRSGKTSNRFC